jgi:hypothetical protein
MSDHKKENEENQTDAVLCSETTTQPGSTHMGLNCRCGCIPSNMLSLFEMAELRKKLKEEREKEAANRKEDPK